METIQPTMNNNNTPITNDATNIDNADIIIDENFTYEGFQVVRGEFFAHMYEPSITFNNLTRLSLGVQPLKAYLAL